MTPPLTAEERTIEGIVESLGRERGLSGTIIEQGRQLSELAGVPSRFLSTVLSGEVANLPFSLQGYYFEQAERVLSEL